MSLHYLLTDDAYNEISQELRDIKAIAGVLATAAGEGDVEGNEVCTLAFLVHNKTVGIESLLNVEPQKVPEAPDQEAPVEIDPLGKGRALIACLRSNYDFLNSVISKSPEIKNQLRELQGEAAGLLENFDSLLIDLEDEPGEAQGPTA